MTTRDQINQEKIEALINILEAADVLTDKEAERLLGDWELGEPAKTALDARERRGRGRLVPGSVGPPEGSGNGRGNSDGGNGRGNN